MANFRPQTTYRGASITLRNMMWHIWYLYIWYEMRMTVNRMAKTSVIRLLSIRIRVLLIDMRAGISHREASMWPISHRNSKSKSIWLLWLICRVRNHLIGNHGKQWKATSLWRGRMRRIYTGEHWMAWMKDHTAVVLLRRNSWEYIGWMRTWMHRVWHRTWHQSALHGHGL